jgi:pilus assembly protein Flp/PilA
MMKKMKALFVEEQGQGMTEYGLILGAIAVAVIAVIALFGDSIATMFKNTITKITADPKAPTL